MSVQEWDPRMSYKAGDVALVQGVESVVAHQSVSDTCEPCPKFKQTKRCGSVFDCCASIGRNHYWISADALALKRLQGKA